MGYWGKTCNLGPRIKCEKGNGAESHRWESYLVQSKFFGEVKNSKRRTHCTDTWGVEKDMGPSMGIEKIKLVCTKSATTS